MARKSIWHRIIYPISGAFRMARARRIWEMFPDIQTRRVCDLGGSRHFWENIESVIKCRDLTILNIGIDGQSESRYQSDRYAIEIYDGSTIPYGDKHFDYLICNSVIEHVPVQDRTAFCAELTRVTKCAIVQTPAYVFPIEPHFVMPFLHWLPRGIGLRLAYISPWRILSRPPYEHVRRYFDEVSLLTRSDLAALLPGARIRTERFLLMPKSYIAIVQDDLTRGD